jgi:hypothetical protein
MTTKKLKGKKLKIEISLEDGNDKEDIKNQTTKSRRTISRKNSVLDNSIKEIRIDNSRDVYFVIHPVEIDK